MLSAVSVQELLEKLPPLVPDVNATGPVGGVPPGAVSVTMAVHDVAWPIGTGLGEQFGAVAVGSGEGTVGLAIVARAKDEPRMSMPNTCEPSGTQARPRGARIPPAPPRLYRLYVFTAVALPGG